MKNTVGFHQTKQRYAHVFVNKNDYEKNCINPVEEYFHELGESLSIASKPKDILM